MEYNQKYSNLIKLSFEFGKCFVIMNNPRYSQSRRGKKIEQKMNNKGPMALNDLLQVLQFGYKNKPQLLHPRHLYTQFSPSPHAGQSDPFVDKLLQEVKGENQLYHLGYPSTH